MFKLGPTTRGSIWMITGFAVCPCHLPVTMPLLLGITAGTALGVFLAGNLLLIGGVSTAYFLLALVLGYRSLLQNKKSNSLYAPLEEDSQFACCLANESPAVYLPVAAEAARSIEVARHTRA